jgi:ubiquinone/menaquinone biosynthesis C-methylase UbiE
MTRKDCQLQLLGEGLFFSLVPAAVTDVNGAIVDYNIAMEVIGGNAINGIRHTPIENLLTALKAQIVEPEITLSEIRTECFHFKSPDCGQLKLKGEEIAVQSPTAGTRLGHVLMWQVMAFDDFDLFCSRHREALGHQLTWETYARSYDRVLLLMPYYQEVQERHFQALFGSPDGPLIDLGAGTGNLVEKLMTAGRTVTAVDSGRAMLNRLRRKVRFEDNDGNLLTVLEANAEHLPMIPDKSQAGVSLLLSLFDMTDPMAGLQTAIRILRPGGKIVVTELKKTFHLDPILSACKEHLLAIGRYEELKEDLNRVVTSNQQLAPGTRSNLRAEDVFNALMASGFEDLTLKDSHFGECSTITGTAPLLLR